MPGSHVAWEITETSTGEVVHAGQRDLRLTDVEVRVTPARARPGLDRLRLGPRQVAADLVGWLLTGGRTTKRVQLGAGFWLVLQEKPGRERPKGVGLQAERDGERTFCWEWFQVDEGGATATKLQETGELGLEWATNRHGHQEVVTTSFGSDVSLRMQPGDGGLRTVVRWRVRVLAGSVIHWPQGADGIQLVPRLRPGSPQSP